MYLHIGGDCQVLMRSVIAILNIETYQNDAYAGFIAYAKKKNTLHEVGEPPFNSAVLLQTDKGFTMYLTPIASSTLLLRTKNAIGTELPI